MYDRNGGKIISPYVIRRIKEERKKRKVEEELRKYRISVGLEKPLDTDVGIFPLPYSLGIRKEYGKSS